jgi:hypothetical protein
VENPVVNQAALRAGKSFHHKFRVSSAVGISANGEIYQIEKC